jgi:DNA polymerase (family 10)
VKQLASEIAGALKKDSSRVAITGSIRRDLSGPKDVDIVVVPKSDKKKSEIREYLRSRSSKIYQDGSSKFSGRIRGVKTEVYFSEPDEYGAQLLHRTGPAGANIQKSVLARSKGLKLSQHGLFKGSQRIAATERGIYNKLGLSYRRPELRGTPRT